MPVKNTSSKGNKSKDDFSNVSRIPSIAVIDKNVPFRDLDKNIGDTVNSEFAKLKIFLTMKVLNIEILLTDTERSEKVRYRTGVDVFVHFRSAQLFSAKFLVQKKTNIFFSKLN